MSNGIDKMQEVVVCDPNMPVSTLMQLTIEKMDKESGPAAVEMLERLVAMHERAEDRQAVKDYNCALAGFQEKCPSIHKNKEVSIKGGYDYKYAPPDKIEEIVGPIMSEFGFSATYSQRCEDGRVFVTCTLSHKEGHSRDYLYDSPLDNKNPMGDMHKTGGATTYARRYALMGALGLVMTDGGTDGHTPPQQDNTPITPEQANDVADLIAKAGLNEKRFIDWYSTVIQFNVTALPELPRWALARTKEAIEQRRKQKEAKEGKS